MSQMGFLTVIRIWFLWFFTYQKELAFHIVIILIKSVVDKNENHYYDKIFFEKCSYQLAKKLSQNFVHSIIMLKFGERKVTKERF